jgi:hypothetical protein
MSLRPSNIPGWADGISEENLRFIKFREKLEERYESASSFYADWGRNDLTVQEGAGLSWDSPAVENLIWRLMETRRQEAACRCA